MITKSLRLTLKLVYQLAQRMIICPSKCRPLNSDSTGTNRCILPSSPIAVCWHQNLRKYPGRGGCHRWSKNSHLRGKNGGRASTSKHFQQPFRDGRGRQYRFLLETFGLWRLTTH